MFLTVNQIVKELEAIQSANDQLNSFEYVNGTYDFEASGSLTYPLMGAILQPGNVSGKIVSTKFDLFFVDLVHPDESNNTDVTSDMQRIALDVFAQFRAYLMNNNIELSPDAPIDDLNNFGISDVSGYKISVTINQFYSRDTCQVPSTYNPTA